MIPRKRENSFHVCSSRKFQNELKMEKMKEMVMWVLKSKVETGCKKGYAEEIKSRINYTTPLLGVR